MKLNSLQGVLLLAVGLAFSAAGENINGINLVNIDSSGGDVGYNYKIGQTEVSVAQWEASGIVAGSATYNKYGTDDAAVVNISWHEAARYCNWLTSGNADVGAYTVSSGAVTGITDHDSVAMSSLVSTYGTVFVLPTEAEWRKAAYWTGSEYSLYANGTSTAPVKNVDANYGNASADGPWDVTGGTTEQNGTLNMMGNVWEWMESTAGGEALDFDDSTQQMAFRGGDWFLPTSDSEDETKWLQEVNSSSDDRAATYNVGFRVAAIPEPGTISLMSLSTIGLFLTRTVRRRRQFSKSILPVRWVRACDVFADCDEMAEDERESYSFYSDIVVPAFERTAVSIKGMQEKMDRNFWNQMVAVHERRIACQEAFKSKALRGLDAFLARIMK